ncbi:MAG: LytTR family DNA-binding domain-containing protein [Bacteroidales bacterium]|nr:LytTR family DNA-binding domain-containing protein [Bacteroidales bacterium]
MSSSRISIRTCKGIRIIECKDIIYCKADDRYTRIYLHNSESHLIAKVLKDYEELLPSEFFLRIHKSYLVNLAFVKEYISNNGRKLVLHDNTELPVSHRKCRLFTNKISKLFPSN